MKAAPTRDEMMAGAVDSNGRLTIYRWNGSSWSSEWNVNVGTSNINRFDIAYRSNSGEAIVFYSGNTSKALSYRTWNGSSWTSTSTYNTAFGDGVVERVVAKGRNASNDMVVVWSDATMNVLGAYFNGTSVTGENRLTTNIQNLSGNYGDTDVPAFDVAFEEQTGRAIAAWGTRSSDTMRYSIRTAGSGGSWQSFQTMPGSFGSRGLIVRMESRPNSNDIALINHGNFYNGSASHNVQAGVWNGSSWSISGTFPPDEAKQGEYDVGVDWMTSGNQHRAVFIYDRVTSSGNGVNYFVYNKNANSFGGSQSYTGGSLLVGGERSNHITVNPQDRSEANVFVVGARSGGGMITSKKVTFDGNNLTWQPTDPGGNPVESNPTAPDYTNGWSFDFAYNRHIPPQALMTDIVTSAGTLVDTPLVGFSAITSGNYCQESTATLGDELNQRIEIINTTTNPLWSLSIAPVGGVDANWSATTDSYDFNDAASAGCGDGNDPDNLKGQLTIDPASGTLEATQDGCGVSGVSLGSVSSFSQGVVDSITLATGSSSAQYDCQWHMYGFSMSQTIPAHALPGSYSLPMTITATAS